MQEVFGGYAAGVRWQRTFGAVLPNDVDPTPEQIVAKWKEITTFGQSPARAFRIAADKSDERATNPSSGPEAAQQMIANFENVSGGSGSGDNESYDDAEDTPEIKAAKAKQLDPDNFTYTERDVMLYNLGVGAKADELHLTYENAEGFAVSDHYLYPSRPDIIASTDFRCHSPIRFFLGSTFRFVRTQLQPHEASSRRTISQAQQGSIPHFRHGPELRQAR